MLSNKLRTLIISEAVRASKGSNCFDFFGDFECVGEEMLNYY